MTSPTLRVRWAVDIVPALMVLAVGTAVPAGKARAVDAVTGASKDALPAGTADAAIWITGRGFADGLTVALSGDGISPNGELDVVPQDARIDGGRGDGITFRFAIAPTASPSPRDITVTGADGSSATLNGGFTVLPPANAPNPDSPDAAIPSGNEPVPGADAGAGPVQPPPPPPPSGRVDVVSRASPSFGEQGAQVNIWVVGRSFQAASQVSFSVPALVPALYNGQPLDIEVVPQAESEQGLADGLIYFLRIPGETPVGDVSITVTNADGSSATGQGIFRVVAQGQVPPPQPGDGNIDALSGASPRAVRAGRHVSMWVWGKGFEPQAQIAFSEPNIKSYAHAEVIRVSQSHPGFSGIRSFLVVEAAAAPGPVRITVTNPNGTEAAADDLLTVVGGQGGPSPGNLDAIGYDGPCPDEVTYLGSVESVLPGEVPRGEAVNLGINGRAIACGASVVIPGGGITALDSPRLVRSDPADPLQTTLFWQIEIAEDAKLGPRDVTVVNPNNSSKTLVGAFVIVDPEEEGSSASGGFVFCQAQPGRGGAPWRLGLLGLLGFGIMAWRRGFRRPQGTPVEP